ncbi:glycosyltransferase [Pleionea sediminis]|uniref:glycosyltransferase n=1 Tax=Pleionea sediminis TaxID=2569479 RepID=UPI0011849280|nr:glycosyltransferase [Pleionea sediminis]
MFDFNSNNTLLVIGYVWPEPNSSAAGRHMLSLLRLFKKHHWRVIFSTPAKKTEFMHDLSSENIESVEIKLNDVSFNEFVRELQPDAVLFDRFMMEEQFGWRVAQECPNAVRILDTEDLQFLRHARHTAFKQNKECEPAFYFNDIAYREISAIHRSDLSLIISSFEFELLQKQFHVPESQLLYLPFLLNDSEFNRKTKSWSERSHFVAIGNFRHAPNWDSVLYLKQLWPKIRQQLPTAELNIYGAYTPPKATALNDPSSGFNVCDRAEDAFEVIENARILLAPLRFGAGIKGKLLDAMITGTPSITTSIGAEGMYDGSDWPGAVEDGFESFVEQAVRLYRDEDSWLGCQDSAKKLLNTRYDYRPYEKALIAALDNILADVSVHRAKHFLGAMMRHQSMNSSEYMSRWIELKTQLNNLTSDTDEDA